MARIRPPILILFLTSIATAFSLLTQDSLNTSMSWIEELRLSLLGQQTSDLKTHPQVEQDEFPFKEDEWCNKMTINRLSGICRLYTFSKTYTQDLVYERNDLVAIDFQDTQIYCTRRDSNNEACSITIKLSKSGNQTGIRLLDHTVIAGQRVYIDSPNTQLIIDSTSSIDASGRSRSNLGSNSENKRGASFIGKGGYCGVNNENKNYGEFDLTPNPDNIQDLKGMKLIGSIGHSNPADTTTQGGGHIHINVDSLTLLGENSHIKANGLPLQNKNDSPADLNGGSGGYIYIKTNNVFDPKNNIDSSASVQAQGGFGKNQGYGGSGGIIVVDSNMDPQKTSQNFLVNGGKTDPKFNQGGCEIGASGTVYFTRFDYLYLNNQGFNTTMPTYANIQSRNRGYGTNQIVAETVVVKGGASFDLIQTNKDDDTLLIPYLEVSGNSSVILTADATLFQLRYMYQIFMDKQSTLDLQSVISNAEIRRTDPIKETLYMDLTKEQWLTKDKLTLGQIKFSRSLTVVASEIHVQSDLIDPASSQLDALLGRIRLFADNIYIYPRVKVEAAKVYLYANDTVSIDQGSTITSLIQNECTTDDTGNKDLYDCIDTFERKEKQLTLQGILDFYNLQYGYKPNVGEPYAVKAEDINFNILIKWRVYIMALGQVILKGTNIKASRIGFCSNNIVLKDSKVDTSARGCGPDQGLGAGQIFKGCAGSGGSHGGNGGRGTSESSESRVVEGCKNTFPQSYYHGKEARYEGSGGASGDLQKSTGGAGGGVIWITTPQTLDITNSTLRADGQWGRVDDYDQYGSGGGSGGSIQISTLNLRGNGEISAVGGSGSSNGGGGGSGGRFVLNYLRGYLATSQPDQSFWWTGTHNLQGGQAGQTTYRFLPPQAGEEGTVFHSKCFPGYSGVFCKACQVGTYKSDYSYGSCLPCLNKPELSYYIYEAETKSVCGYECNNLLENSKTNPDCLTPGLLEVQRVGGIVPFFLLLLTFLLTALYIFIVLTYRSESMRAKLKNLPDTIYQDWEQRDESGRGKVTETDIGMRDANIWCHTHRMYIIGFNSIRFPWFIPKDFPRDALKKQDREKFLQFIDEQNQKLKYSALEKLSFVLVKTLFPPLAKFFHLSLRKRKFNQLQKDLHLLFPPQFWGDKGSNKSLRLSCSKSDYQMAFIDFVDFSRNRNNWLGLKLPMPILLSGSGTYNHPFKLEFEEDTYAKSLALINFEFLHDKLPIFLENFNSQLSKLSFLKLETLVMRDISKTVRWLEKANKTMFNIFGIKCVLYIIENQYSEVQGGVFKQKRRSFPLESIFIDAFPEMFSVLLNYVKAKVMSHKSEIKLAIVFKRHDPSKQERTEQRVGHMTKSKEISPYLVAVAREESVLFDENDNGKEEERISFVARSDDPLASTQTSLLNSNSNLYSDAQMHLDQSNKVSQIKLVDKTRRAFSISVESSKAFELAIRKPRRKMKHLVTSIRARIYALYLLLMKHHGSPPNSKHLSLVFCLFSGVVALDLLLVVIYSMHLFLPASNFLMYGWPFLLIILGLPYLSPLLTLIAVFLASESLLKSVGNMNSIILTINIPLTFLLSWYNKEDPVYFLYFTIMIALKILHSGLSAKIRMFLINPRYSQNQEKIMKEKWRYQGEKEEEEEEVKEEKKEEEKTEQE